MKQLQILILAFISVFLLSCSDNKGLSKLTGEVLNRTDGNLFLYSPGSSQFDKDTIPFNDGKFEYAINSNSPEVYVLFFEEDENDGDGFTSVDFFLGGEDVHIKLSMENIKNPQVNGGQLNNKFINVMSEYRKIEDKLISYYDNLQFITDSLKIETARDSMTLLTNEMEQYIPNYIKNNNDLISAYFVWLMRNSLDKDELENFITPLVNEFSESKYIKETTTYISGFGATEVGQDFTNYTLLDINDSEISLSDVVKDNKVTHLLFWSSRCENTDGKLQAYKSFYEKYKDLGYEVIAISDDCYINRWTNAIKRNDTNWLNLLDFDKSQCVAEFYHYDIDGDVLIDNNGKIIYRTLGSSQLNEKLDEILNDKTIGNKF